MNNKLKILLVEDNDDHAHLFKSCLNTVCSQGALDDATLHRAHDLEDGEHLASSYSFDCVMLDLGLPESQGLETLMRFAGLECDAPVVVLTSSEDHDLSLQAIRNGAQDFISKGELSPSVIARSIRYAMERHELIVQLRKSNEDLAAFASAAAHDLKAPLRHIGMFIRQIVEQLGDNVPPETQDCFDKIETSTNRLSGLIQSLLEFSHLGENADRFDRCQIDAIVKEAIDHLAAEVASSGASVSLDEVKPLSVYGSHELIVRVLQNLAGNAIKYVDGRTPKIAISVEDKSEHILLSVSDNGIGIEEDDFARIFEPLRRLHSPQRYPGSGIGLAICTRIVSAHGGKIWIRSKVGEGSTFYVSLPKPREEVGP